MMINYFSVDRVIRHYIRLLFRLFIKLFYMLNVPN